MRVKVVLNSGKKTIPVNYNYFISSAIYNFLSTTDLEFSTKLHFGWHTLSKKNFKFFTFSRLEIGKREIQNDKINIFSDEIYLYISSPWNEFLTILINGIFRTGFFRIGKQSFEVNKIEILKSDIPKDNYLKLKMKCLSPIVITTKKEYNNKLSKYYYKSKDDQNEISEKIKNNLINKYEAFYYKKTDKSNIKITFDQGYISTGKSDVLIHYLKNDLDIKIPAINCPFEIEGDKELINFGYECGFGEMNSAGLGMVEIIK